MASGSDAIRSNLISMIHWSPAHSTQCETPSVTYPSLSSLIISLETFGPRNSRCSTYQIQWTVSIHAYSKCRNFQDRYIQRSGLMGCSIEGRNLKQAPRFIPRVAPPQSGENGVRNSCSISSNQLARPTHEPYRNDSSNTGNLLK